MGKGEEEKLLLLVVGATGDEVVSVVLTREARPLPVPLRLILLLSRPCVLPTDAVIDRALVSATPGVNVGTVKTLVVEVEDKEEGEEVEEDDITLVAAVFAAVPGQRGSAIAPRVSRGLVAVARGLVRRGDTEPEPPERVPLVDGDVDVEEAGG
jgi:hypothetical protein